MHLKLGCFFVSSFSFHYRPSDPRIVSYSSHLYLLRTCSDRGGFSRSSSPTTTASSPISHLPGVGADIEPPVFSHLSQGVRVWIYSTHGAHDSHNKSCHSHARLPIDST